jgi:hypothetical protein
MKAAFMGDPRFDETKVACLMDAFKYDVAPAKAPSFTDTTRPRSRDSPVFWDDVYGFEAGSKANPSPAQD